MAKGIGASLPVLLVILVGIIVIVVIWRNKNFLRFGTANVAAGNTDQNGVQMKYANTGNFVYKDLADVNQPNGTKDSTRWDIPNTAISQIT